MNNINSVFISEQSIIDLVSVSTPSQPDSPRETKTRFAFPSPRVVRVTR